ncbi:MAG: rubrerythrin [Spirochaetes bacterium]|nr:rubrerythrin [Spirochaetota bacterium]
MGQVRCKACGFIMRENKLGEVCPACGVPRTVFEPYHENISKKRKVILDLYLHPIILHFPQAIAALLPPLILLGVALGGAVGRSMLGAAWVLSVLLPFSVLGAFAAGLLDGKTRFKKLSTPLLIKKIIIGSILLLLSAIIGIVAMAYGIDYPGRLYILLLSLGCIACEIALAQAGKTMMNAKLPG